MCVSTRDCVTSVGKWRGKMTVVYRELPSKGLKTGGEKELVPVQVVDSRHRAFLDFSTQRSEGWFYGVELVGLCSVICLTRNFRLGVSILNLKLMNNLTIKMMYFKFIYTHFQQDDRI